MKIYHIAITSFFIIIYLLLYLFFLGKSFWGLWDDTTLKKILVIRESSIVNAADILGASGDPLDKEYLSRRSKYMTPSVRFKR